MNFDNSQQKCRQNVQTATLTMRSWNYLVQTMDKKRISGAQKGKLQWEKALCVKELKNMNDDNNHDEQGHVEALKPTVSASPSPVAMERK